MSKIFTLVLDCIGNQINQSQLDKSSLVGKLDPSQPQLPDPELNNEFMQNRN